MKFLIAFACDCAEICFVASSFLLPFALILGVACGLKYLFFAPSAADEGRRCLREAVEIVADQPPQKRTLGLVMWSKDKIVLEEVWTRQDPEPEE